MDRPLPPRDLDQIVSYGADFFNELRGASVFITGATGFFGRWLVESLLSANRTLQLGCRLTVLTRQTEFKGSSEVKVHYGDVRHFEFPSGQFTHIIHAATEAREKRIHDDPNLMRSVIIQGTRHMLEMAGQCGAKKFLFTSSGAVYGSQPPQTTHLTEDDPGFKAPLLAPSAYAEGKREAERLCLEASKNGLGITIARGFAFVGPGLPLDAHFAVGNFMRDALKGGPIRVQSDGTAVRSYLYGADLALWLWAILLKGKRGRAYNVGSERRVTILELAKIVARETGEKIDVQLSKSPSTGQPVDQYVPSTARIRAELGLKENVPLEEAVRRTLTWHWSA